MVTRVGPAGAGFPIHGSETRDAHRIRYGLLNGQASGPRLCSGPAASREMRSVAQTDELGSNRPWDTCLAD